MQPLARQTRIIFLLSLTALFLFIVPLVMLYANGWRFSPSLGLYKTGGVFVSVPYSGVTVSINGEEIGTTGLLQRGFYVGNLAPSTYVLRATGDDYYPWERMLVVEPQLVTDARAFLMSTKISTIRVVATSTSTTTEEKVVPVGLLHEYNALFAAPRIASSSLATDSQNDTSLFVEDGDLIARWTNPESPIPSFFCARPSLCATEFAVERSSDTVVDAAFFAGGIVYSTEERGMYITEIDSRPTPRIVPIFEEPGVEFRIIDGELIIKRDANFYQVEL